MRKVNKVYTGYYAKTKRYKENDLFTVAISQTIPITLEVDAVCSILSPSPVILWRYKNGEIDEFEYTRLYKEQLNNTDGLVELIKEQANSMDTPVIFLCYEKPDKFCHRHVLADWIEENCGVVVEEYKVD